jgi:hypothetical protein
MPPENWHVGTLVIQPNRPEWGPGKIVKVVGPTRLRRLAGPS